MLKQGLLSHFCVAISMCQFHQQSNCCGEGCNRLVVVHCSTASMAWIILTSVLLRIRDSFRVQECVFVLDSSNFCLKGHGDTPQYEYFLYYFFCFFSSLNSFVSCLRAFHGHCRGSMHSPEYSQTTTYACKMNFQLNILATGSHTLIRVSSIRQGYVIHIEWSI